MLQLLRTGSAGVLVSTLIIAMCSSRAAAAQTSSVPVGSPSRVRIGQTVWVTTNEGREVHGKISSVSGTEIGVQTGQVVAPIPWTEVLLIQAPDSVVNGLVKGAIIGGLAGGLPAALYAYGECCWNPPSRGEFITVYAALGAGIGMGVGVLVDSLRTGRRQVYKAGPAVSIAPAVVPGIIAVSATVRW